MYPSRSDEELAASAASGDQGAFTTLMARYVDGLHRFARRYLGSADEATDAVQQTFVSAWFALPRYDPARPFGPWLRYIALNKCRDLGRRRKLRRVLFGVALDDEAALKQVDPAVSPEEAAIVSERNRRVAAAVAALPRHLKEPLLLTVFEGLTQKDAAALLNLTTKAVELRVSRARQKLYKALVDLSEQNDEPD